MTKTFENSAEATQTAQTAGFKIPLRPIAVKAAPAIGQGAFKVPTPQKLGALISGTPNCSGYQMTSQLAPQMAPFAQQITAMMIARKLHEDSLRKKQIQSYNRHQIMKRMRRYSQSGKY